ncbi:hypothetical protein GINT2_000204 [Glugoides intestinalis]
MANQEENNTKMALLEKTIEFTRKVDSFADDVLQMLKSKDSSALEPIKPAVEARRNAMKILEFYDVYLGSLEKLQEINKKIDEAGILKKAIEIELSIKDLESYKILRMLEEVSTILITLEKYSAINIANKCIVDQKKKMKELVEIVKGTVLYSLKRLPKVVKHIDQYSRFVILNADKDAYLREYVDIFILRMGFVSIKNNEKAILQQTKNLTAYFGMVKELNRRILGSKCARKVNEGIIQLLVLDLKTVLSECLMKIDKDQSPEDIVFLIQLYSQLRHSGGSIAEEIEKLFELKPEIIKLIFNCFIQFFGQLDLQEKPNTSLQAEKIVILLSEILKKFSRNKEVKREWCERFGNSFGVHNVKDLNQNFCEKCLLKISELAEKVEDKLRPVYMINNIHALKDYIIKFLGLDIKKIVYKNCELVVGFLRLGLELKSPVEAYRYLFDELSKAKLMWLPEEERQYVREKIKKLFEEAITNKLIHGNPQKIVQGISEAYNYDLKEKTKETDEKGI